MSDTVQILHPADDGYENIRNRCFNARVPNRRPAEIVLPWTTAEVAYAIKRANAQGLKVGVRSGGHHFPCSPLRDSGMLLDLKDLNKAFDYNKDTKIISFSPAHTVQDISTTLRPHKRFFPHGHSRTVGMGGFYLAGGQGCFVRGWGYTCDGWVTQLEVVTANGDIVIANATENQDLFWAAPGSGVGFFGVITRMWGKTIPSKKLYDVSYIVDSTDIFKPLLKWSLQTAERVPRYGSDLFICTFYADAEEKTTEDESKAKRVFMLLNQTVHCDSMEEALVLASPWQSFPDAFRKHLVAEIPMTERQWEELWDLQERFQPHGAGERWKVDSVISDATVSLDEFVDKITPALFDLPTRRATGAIIPLDYIPDEADHALSLPQKSTVSTLVCYSDPALDAKVDTWMKKTYTELEKVAVGIYVADHDKDQRLSRVMTDSALRKWLKIRAKYDPYELFTGHHGFDNVLPENQANGRT
ncbi:hypothetical protein LTR84_000198 [Exophiala bonariae]|uniref:FAD-binding PCMH-type domain-containing protein n=1 Tax=Exophiala bonariae TaxID=1690606 RepID=A0AAV9NTW6_9EURO|nr:hypothetical protein LTR84_000198 [Exophiala bonariae]